MKERGRQEKRKINREMIEIKIQREGVREI